MGSAILYIYSSVLRAQSSYSKEIFQRRVDTRVNPSNIHTKCVKNGVQHAYERRLNGVYTEEEFTAMYPSATVGVPMKGQRLVIRGGSATEENDAVRLSQEPSNEDEAESVVKETLAYGLDELFAQLPLVQKKQNGEKQAQRA